MRHRRAEARVVPDARAASATLMTLWAENASTIASPLARPPMPSALRVSLSVFCGIEVALTAIWKRSNLFGIKIYVRYSNISAFESQQGPSQGEAFDHGATAKDAERNRRPSLDGRRADARALPGFPDRRRLSLRAEADLPGTELALFG